jgi:hypothetical protein
MGTIYYIARDDNRTLFEMGKAYLFAIALNESDDEPYPNVPCNRESLMPLLSSYGDMAGPVADAVLDFLDGNKGVLCSEHDRRRDPDMPGSLYRVVGEIYQVRSQ